MAKACVRDSGRFGFLPVMLLAGRALINTKVGIVLKVLLIMEEDGDCNRHSDDLTRLVYDTARIRLP